MPGQAKKSFSTPGTNLINFFCNYGIEIAGSSVAHIF